MDTLKKILLYILKNFLLFDYDLKYLRNKTTFLEDEATTFSEDIELLAEEIDAQITSYKQSINDQRPVKSFFLML